MLAEDMSVYFDEEAFGTAALLDGVKVSGIFDDAYVTVDDVASSGPAFLLPSVDAVGVVEGGSTLALVHPVTGVAMSYVVSRKQPDGTGVSVLHVRKA